MGSASSSLSNATGTGYCRYYVERAVGRRSRLRSSPARPTDRPTERDRQWTRATCGLANWLLAMMCSSFVRSLAAAMAAICTTAFPDLGQNADWSAKNERGEGEGDEWGGRGGGKEAEHRYFRVVAAVLAESSATEGGNGVGRPVGKRKRIQETAATTTRRADARTPWPKLAEAANFMRNCSVRNFSGWGSRRWEGRGRTRAGGRADRPDIWKESGCHRCLRRQPPKFFGGILINF